MRAEIKELHQRLKTTTVYVTHDQVEAMTLGDRLCVMSGGEVQQVGTTDDIYNRPANTFVAGFMGSPPMNLVAGEVRGGVVRVAGAALADFSSPDAPVTVGFRPEDLRIVGPLETDSVPVRIDVCEPLGSHVLVHALVDGSGAESSPTKVIAQAPPGTTYDPGARVGLTVAPGKTFVFDAETGRAAPPPTRERIATA
jgi:sn-glycerol 3-phosphate transport system ATP-binding protein